MDIPEPHEFTAYVQVGHGGHAHTYKTEFSEEGHHPNHGDGHSHGDHTHGADDEDSPEYQDAHARAHAADLERRFAGRTVTTPQIVLFGLTVDCCPARQLSRCCWSACKSNATLSASPPCWRLASAWRLRGQRGSGRGHFRSAGGQTLQGFRPDARWLAVSERRCDDGYRRLHRCHGLTRNIALTFLLLLASRATRSGDRQPGNGRDSDGHRSNSH